MCSDVSGEDIWRNGYNPTSSHPALWRGRCEARRGRCEARRGQRMRLKEAWTGSYVVWEWDLGDLGMWQDNLGMRLWLSVNVAGNWE